MNTKILRMKNGKRGITPVIATIILIAVTLVLALVVGAYTFGLFGSNVKQITLTSGSLFAGNVNTKETGFTGTVCTNSGQSYISMSLNDPGAATTISGFTLTGTALSGTAVTTSYLAPPSPGTCTLTSSSPAPAINGGAVTSLTLYFSNSTVITTGAAGLVSGQTYNYVINFQNGQSVSGVFEAQ